MTMLTHTLLLAAAGGVGTLLRAACTAAATSAFGPTLPVGTLAVNVGGSFAFGVIMSLTRARMVSDEVEVSLLVGLMGGFTTYSTFAFQTVAMLEAGRLPTAVGYMVATNALGLVAVWAGLRCVG